MGCHVHTCIHKADGLVKLAAHLQGSVKALEVWTPTFWVLVGVGDVLPLVTAHALSADFLPHHQGAIDGLVHRSIFLPDPVHHISIDLGEHKGCVVLGAQVTLLDGPH